MPNFKSSSLGRLSLHLEVVDHIALSQRHHLVEVLSLLTSSRQRSHILLNQRTDGLLVEVTTEDKGELTCILEAVFRHSENAVVVDILQILHVDVGETRIVSIECCSE